MMATSKTGKRPLRSLSAHEKLEAIRRVHDGESKASVARDIGVPESTLRGWCKNEGKITYLSRQSSPETDEPHEPKEKRSKIEDPTMVQPFNLSLKSSNSYTPNSESLYTPVDYSKSDMMDATPKTPQNLSIKTETPKSTASQITERERNRAELARLSIELGLNRPEMLTNNSAANITDIATNLNILSQWNSLVMQQQLLNGQTNKKIAAAADTTTNILPPPPLPKQSSSSSSSAKPPKEQQSVEDYVKCWLRAQEVLLASQARASANNSSNGLSLSPPTTQFPVPGTTSTTTSSIPSTANGLPNNYNSSWFWQWCKQVSYQQQQSALASSTPEKQILYQQLTKDANNGIESLAAAAAAAAAASNNHQAQEKHSTITNTNGNVSGNNYNKNASATNNNNHNVNNNNSGSKVKSVLDNLFILNNNNNPVNKPDENKESPDNNLSQSEALEHGEKFMKWLESCSDPSVTTMQIMQFKTLLNNLKNGADRRNGDMRQNKTKVKRK